MCKAIYKYLAMALAAAVAVLAMPGCTGEEVTAPALPDAGFTINFHSTRATTRADEPGEDRLNENKISSLVVALYPEDYGNNQYAQTFRIFRNLSATGSYSCRMHLTREEITSLYGTESPADGATCKIFAVANLPEEVLKNISIGNTSISSLKNISTTAQFETLQLQPDFIMSGQSTVSYQSVTDIPGTKGMATGDVPLTRTAAKITLNVKLPENVRQSEDSDIYWWPLPSQGMRVLLNNGVMTSKVESDGTNNEDSYYYDILTSNDKTWGFSENETVAADSYRWQQTYPFYTYPNQWENSPSEMHRTSMTLIIPWQRGNVDGPTDTTYETFYYSVPVTASELTQITSNYSYRIDLNVNMLGSRSPEMPEEMDGTYQVVNWTTENMDINITDTRYLVVSPKTYEINNLDEFTLRFNSSHPVVVEDITMSYNRFNFITQAGNADMGTVVSFPTEKAVIDRSVSGDYKLVDYPQEISSWNPKTKQYEFTLKHELYTWTPINDENATTITGRNTVNQSGFSVLGDSTTVQNSIKKYLRPTSPDAAYSPYTFKVTLRHEDNSDFKETFTLVQYPAMWIKAVKNPGNGSSDHPGNNFVNGTSTQLNGLGSISTLRGDNRNPNMYVISVSKLDTESGYYIGDPRSLYSENNLSTQTGNYYNRRYPNLPRTTSDGAEAEGWCTQSPALYDKSNNRRLKYYYPAVESEEEYYKMMIAPKIRIASSYGTTSSMNRDNARRRCATYQEEDCPAGRWRLPTYGELLYIIGLSAKGKIPELFTPGTNTNGYWCAQGGYYVLDNGTLQWDNSANNSTSHAVRCVYDEWYWEKETNYTISPNANGRYTYTLGDMPKRNPQQGQ